jgi:hypothetical protein
MTRHLLMAGMGKIYVKLKLEMELGGTTEW